MSTTTNAVKPAAKTKATTDKLKTIPFAKQITAETNRKHFIALANEVGFKPRVPRLPNKVTSKPVSSGQIPEHTWVGFTLRMNNWTRAFSLRHPEKAEQISKLASFLV